MRDVELIVDWVQTFARELHEEIEGLDEAALAWRPDPGGNSIGVTVWHCARWFDVLATQVFGNKPASTEAWFTEGWAARTGHDPHGIGLGGLGTVTGYSLDEVAAIPTLAAADLLPYFDAVCVALCAGIQSLPAGDLEATAPALGGRRTYYRWLRTILLGEVSHLGEIRALKAMRARQAN